MEDLAPGPRVLGRLTLLSVVALVVSVSLVLLRDFASLENERDAARTVRLLGTALAEGPAEVDSLAEVAGRRPELLERLPDHRWVAEGRLLLRHGYLFEASRVRREGRAQVAVRAWPWAFGRTGHAAFAWDGSGRLWGHPGHDGWSGEGSPPPLSDLRGGSWRHLAPGR